MKNSDPQTIQRQHAADLLASLTDRQTEVMEHAAAHLPNKEIARKLGLSPSTIEQRFQYVKAKLETADRASTIREYVRLRAICGQTAYGFSHLDPEPELNQFPPQDAAQDDRAVQPNMAADDYSSLDFPPSRLEVLDGKYGPWWRLLVIFTIAFTVAATALVVTAISVTVGDIL